MALTLQPIRSCPQHSGETGTRLSSAIHRRLLSQFFLREGGREVTRGNATVYSLSSLRWDVGPLKGLTFGAHFWKFCPREQPW